MLDGIFDKEPSEKFDIPFRFNTVMLPGETISSCTVAATKVSDGSDQSSVVLSNTGGPPPNANLVSGTATGGSTTSIIDTTRNFYTAGIKPGDKIFNSARKFVATVLSIASTTNAFDTVNFEAQNAASQNGDAYTFFVAKASVKAGTDGVDYKITCVMTFSTGRVLEDEVVMRVRDL